MKKKKYFRITFCCSEDEKRAIDKTAKDCGMSTSKFCKRVILGYKPKYRLTPEDLKLLQDVRKATADLTHIKNYFKCSNHQLLIEEVTKIVDNLKVVLYDCNR